MIADIEDGILALIRAQNYGYSIPVVESYAGELSARQEDLVRIIARLPAVWATFLGESAPKSYDSQRRAWVMPAKFAVYVCTKNLRGRKFSRLGANPLEVGAYQIAEDIRATLVNQDLGLSIDYLNPGPVKTLFNVLINGNPLAALSIELTTKYVVNAVEPSDVDWLRTGLHYHRTPDDGIADASDLITLRS